MGFYGAVLLGQLGPPGHIHTSQLWDTTGAGASLHWKWHFQWLENCMASLAGGYTGMLGRGFSWAGCSELHCCETALRVQMCRSAARHQTPGRMTT